MLLVDIALLYLSSVVYLESKHVNFSVSSIEIELNEERRLFVRPNESLFEAAMLIFTYDIDGVVEYKQPKEFIYYIDNTTIPANSTKEIPFIVKSKTPGHLTLGVNSTSTELEDLHQEFIRIDIYHATMLVTINAVIGWMYFAAWTISFYPQLISNYFRKSVVGLNFDYIAYNIVGFVAYGLFNIGMYWISDVKHEYMKEHPRGINPVQLNDVIFTIHAVMITLFLIFQCFIYERGNQRVSNVCRILVGTSILFSVIALFVAVGGAISWLNYLYYFSYIKLGVTLIKYVPQAYMNYRRKSTDGWSICNVLLDCTGGSLSVLQMVLLSYNSNDWESIFGDPTKFGLGFFSILFDVLFIVQHYVLYRGNPPCEDLEVSFHTECNATIINKVDNG